MIQLTSDQIRQIDDALSAGAKIEAIKMCRESAQCSLTEAKEFVESRPAAALIVPSSPISSTAMGASVLLVVLLAMGAYVYLGLRSSRPAKPATPPTSAVQPPAERAAPPATPATAVPTTLAPPAIASVVTDTSPQKAPAPQVPLAQVQRPELIMAAEQGDLEKVRQLLDAGADVNIVRKGDQVSPLFAAARRAPDKGFEVAKLLLERGADANHKRQGGDTALLIAARSRSVKTVQLLLEHGADVNARNAHGLTALDLAGGWADMVEILKSAGATSGRATQVEAQ